ncbi:MAG: hypothetical protein JRM80_02365 [Nitrososphaerota archaeon]|nr:hypothetical protein [Nitrososphaerota archaeon]
MSSFSRRRLLPVALGCVLVAGLFTPMVALEQSNGTGQQAQLAALVSAAESSKTYTTTAVNYAAANGLDVGGARAQLNQGDSLLAAAQSDLQAGTNLSAGIEAVQAAMSDYEGAAAASTIALSDAGLTASVDYDAALAAVAETNATVSIVASVVAQACAGASGAQALVQACAQAGAQAASAKADLDQAASLLAQTNGHMATSADISQALSLVAQARTEAGACQSELLTIASYTYPQRGQVYLSTVVNPAYSAANSTIKDEAAVQANLSAYQESWTAYVRAQTPAAAEINSSASALSGAIAAVETGAVSASISAAQSTAGKVGADMSALLNLAGILALPNLVSAIQASASATSSYSGALATAGAWNSAYSGTQLSGFASYLSTGNADSTAVQTSGAAYVSDYQAVVVDLGGYLAVPGVSSIYYDLTSLQVSSTASGASASLQQEVSAVGTVESDVSAFNAAVSAGQSAIVVGSSLLSSAAKITASRPAYLNATADAALGEVSAGAQAAAQAALSYVAAAQTCLQASAGTYAGSLATLLAAGSSLGTQTRISTGAAASALSYVQGDYDARTAETASGRAYVSQALLLFSSQNVEAGVAAMAQAYAQFQAASSVSA